MIRDDHGSSARLHGVFQPRQKTDGDDDVATPKCVSVTAEVPVETDGWVQCGD